MQDRAREEQLARAREIQALNADPFDIEAQTRIAEIIRAEQVQENLHNAMEHNPEGDREAPEFKVTEANVYQFLAV